MAANVGSADRGIRIIIGLVAIAAMFVGPFAGPGWARIALGAVGVIMIATSAMSFCPLYRIFGIRTCKI